MRKPFSRLCSLLLAAWMLAAPTLAAAPPEGDTVTLSTAEDLCRLAKNCALDTWSQGRTVVLAADLDLEGTEFTPIPTFGGTFLGQGHTISGLRVDNPGSTQGLFRYIQPEGVVRDLTVKGTVAPSGTRSTVGGIAGDNAGTLEHCAFQGAVQGESAVGGVAGRNSATGQIISCSASGSVSGESATGGIVGRNLGLLLSCENSAGVNLTQTETPVDLLGADAGAALEERAAADEETYHLLSGCTDTGGVAGYSSGVIQSCSNRGDVGYPHVGYNTGGIAGRQCGYLSGCLNTGSIHGRKDVGGIAGQAEPYLVSDPGPDTLEQLRAELDTLDRLINRALDNAQQLGDDVSLRLEAMGSFAGDARDRSQELLNRVSGFTDENIGAINTLAADITNALETISPALDRLSDTGRRLEQLSRQLGEALDSLGGAADSGGRVVDDLRAAARRLLEAQGQLDQGAARFRRALDILYRAVFPEEGAGPVQPAPEELEAALAELRGAWEALTRAGSGLEGALSELRQALDSAGPLSGQLGDTLEELQDAVGSSAAIGRLLRQSFNIIGGAVDDLTRDGPAEFIPLGDSFRQSSDGLFDSLSGLSGEMEGLRTAVQDGNRSLNADLRAVSRQFNVVFDVMLDALSDLGGGADQEAVIQDTSEEDIAATREGKVSGCRNTGPVEGDRNVGGVIGAMSIELDLDPEDDGKDLFSFGSTYETKAVLQGCLNYGGVTAKKDCVGGIAGRMDLGTALDCQSYGPVSSTSGDYVGGVAGYADASIRSCYAKNSLSGKNYVGGIAGWASRLRDCWAIASVQQGSECLGAIAGGVETGGTLLNNRFVDTGTAGVDGVSYAGRAEPVPFDQLSQLPDIPLEFTSFTLTLLAQGETVAQIPFLYGEDLSRLQLPPVPEQEGCYGAWPELDRSSSDLTVEAVYAPWVTVAASQELSGKLSLALAEGQFTGDAALHVTDSTQAPPQEAGEESAVWEVSLTGTGLGPEDTVPLRLLNPFGGRAAVWQYQDGQWQRIEALPNGQYLTLTMEGVRGVFCIQPQEEGTWTLPVLGAGALAALLLIAGIVWSKKRPAKKKKAKTGPAGK